MKRNKILAIVLSLMVAATVLAGCGSTPKETSNEPAKEAVESSQETATYEDGIYFAQEGQFSEKSGWKYMVTLEVKDGKIIDVDWNGANVNAGPDKKTASKSGAYGMVENGGAQAPWYEQAQKAEAYLLEKQNPTAIEYKDNEGHTDAISGVSIHVMEFFKLAEEALTNGPVEKGQYKDGAYHAEEPDFSAKSGWKYTADLTVVNGNIVAANWSGVHKDGGDDKKTASKSGAYGMVENGGAQAPWFEQAQKAEAYLLESQDPTAIEYKDDQGHTDAVSGVSITVGPFFKLAEEALSQAK